MSKTIAIFGAGSGLGAATARRFGREGYAVALVARRPEPLAELAARLGTEGIDAESFTADLSDPSVVPGLLERITTRFDRIDVVAYAPVGSVTKFTRPASQMNAEFLREHIDLLLNTPVELARAVVPPMVERGDGGFLVALGASAQDASAAPGMSGAPSVAAATRHWVHALNQDLAATGVYAGLLLVGAVVDGSQGQREAEALGIDLTALPTVAPADLADVYFDLFTKRDHVEQIAPQNAS
ncbi:MULTISPECIES: SDR family NAD(P)-dependent oxidoreductase [Streptomyces]|uniref:SDR family NAD(P)-dependent oxidoreductase n=2 Tax=Streptomyces rhizosphaericus TaxID=114699 RepID=A0ABP4D0L0_9ACTN|nr:MULTISPECIES: SDR family NAD(P)-dependent oxidoreductase [Streptomyces violaceusniger group]